MPDEQQPTLLQMIERAEAKFDRKLTPEEYYLATRAHAVGMTLEQMFAAVDKMQEPAPDPGASQTYRYEAIGKDARPIPDV